MDTKKNHEEVCPEPAIVDLSNLQLSTDNQSNSNIIVNIGDNTIFSFFSNYKRDETDETNIFTSWLKYSNHPIKHEDHPFIMIIQIVSVETIKLYIRKNDTPIGDDAFELVKYHLANCPLFYGTDYKNHINKFFTLNFRYREQEHHEDEDIYVHRDNPDAEISFTSLTYLDSPVSTELFLATQEGQSCPLIRFNTSMENSNPFYNRIMTLLFNDALIYHRVPVITGHIDYPAIHAKYTTEEMNKIRPIYPEVFDIFDNGHEISTTMSTLNPEPSSYDSNIGIRLPPSGKRIILLFRIFSMKQLTLTEINKKMKFKEDSRVINLIDLEKYKVTFDDSTTLDRFDNVALQELVKIWESKRLLKGGKRKTAKKRRGAKKSKATKKRKAARKRSKYCKQCKQHKQFK
jgi:hypothetical protein